MRFLDLLENTIMIFNVCKCIKSVSNSSVLIYVTSFLQSAADNMQHTVQY